MVRRVFSLLTVIFLLFSLNLSVSACEDTNISIPIITGNTQGQEINGQARATDIINPVIFRAGPNSTSCDLYMNWRGTLVISAIKYGKITIKNTSILYPYIYKEVGSASNLTTVPVQPAANGTIYITSLKIPADVDYVTVHITRGLVYDIAEAFWLECWTNPAGHKTPITESGEFSLKKVA